MASNQALQEKSNQEELLQQVQNFVKGSSRDAKLPTTDRVQSAIVLLRSLPSTRFAVLEYFASVYDDVMYRILSPVQANEEDTKNEVIENIQGSILQIIDSNPNAWSPIFSAWCIELLGQLSSKYSSKYVESKSLSPTASLNELLQMWLNCYCTKSLIEIASQCIAAMVGDTPDSCVDALLETSVKHSPHFDWVVAHIGSCFPRTIIRRVLMVGLKDYVSHAKSQSNVNISADDKMRKFKSVVDILGHLAAQHSREIKMALFDLFQESLEVEAENRELSRFTVPFMLQLASMSNLLLTILTTEFTYALTNDVMNKLADMSSHWFKKGSNDPESLLTLAVHLVTISDQGALALLQLLLDTAYPKPKSEPMDQSDSSTMTSSQQVSVTSSVRKCSHQILSRVVLDLSRVVHSKCGDSALDVPFLKGLQQHAVALCKDLFSSEGQRHACLKQFVKFVAISGSDNIASSVLSQTLLRAKNTTQMDYWLELQIELQIKHPDVLKNSIQELLSNLDQSNHSNNNPSNDPNNGETSTAVKNMLAVVQWEKGLDKKDKAANTPLRCELTSCLEAQLPALTSLLTHHDNTVALTTMQIVELLPMSEMPLANVTRLCFATVNFLFRALNSRDVKQKFQMCTSCRNHVRNLLGSASAQKTLAKLLLEEAILGEDRKCIGGKVTTPSPATTSTLTQAATPGLLDDIRTSAPLTGSRPHGGVIRQRSRTGQSANFTKEEIQQNQQLYLDLLWTICCHGNTSGGGSADKSSGENSRDSSSGSPNDRKLSAHVSKSLALMMIELVTDDVMYNGIPWPEEEFMKVTIERDLQIRKRFEDNALLWDIFDFLSTGVGAMCYCSAIIRGLMATLIFYWDRCRDKMACTSPWQLQASCYVIAFMKKGQFIPAPLCYSGELLEQLTPHEVFLVLMNLWRFMKDYPPVPEERDWSSVDPKYSEVIHSILHRNIDKFGHLYSRFFRPST